MRYAILSDIHGNLHALEAVLADIAAAGGVDGYLLLGDYAAIGPDPVAVIDRIRALPNATFVRGNTDRYASSAGMVEKWVGEMQTAPGEHWLPVACALMWTMGATLAGGRQAWLGGLPVEARLSLPDGTRVLCVHAAPGTDDGRGLPPDLSDDELAAALVGSDADLVLIGHTHLPFQRTSGNVTVLNPGSLSNSPLSDLRAKYALLHADASGYRLEPRRVEYDRDAVIARIAEVNHPSAVMLTRFMRAGMRG